MNPKTKFPRGAALIVAKQLCDGLKSLCHRLVVAGSLRRRKAEVGDIEILYIPRIDVEPDGLFMTKPVNLVDLHLARLRADGIISRRLNERGSEMWGDKNKFARHIASGIPVDFFSATEANWFNYLVCRTGGAENNRRIAMAAQARGLRWNPYGEGFTSITGELVRVASEEDCFRLVGLPYLEPMARP